MQDSKKTKSRKGWYQKAMQVANLWRIVLKFPDHHHHHHQNHHNNSNDKFSGNAKLRKCSSTSSNSKPNMSMPTTPPRTLSYPSSLTRSCLCSPISYTDSFRCDLPPRRSVSSNGSSNYQSPFPPMPAHHNHQGGDFYPNFLQPKLNGAAINGYAPLPPRRRVFRGKSVMDNSLMRRSVIEEEAMMMKRSIEELAFVQRKNSLKRRQLGPSPLSRVVMAADC